VSTTVSGNTIRRTGAALHTQTDVPQTDSVALRAAIHWPTGRGRLSAISDNVEALAIAVVSVTAVASVIAVVSVIVAELAIAVASVIAEVSVIVAELATAVASVIAAALAIVVVLVIAAVLAITVAESAIGTAV
jgi:hypothetical protein